MALTKVVDSMVMGLTVSVLPSRYRRVMEASYVRQNLLPASWDGKGGEGGGKKRAKRSGDVMSVISCILAGNNSNLL